VKDGGKTARESAKTRKMMNSATIRKKEGAPTLREESERSQPGKPEISGAGLPAVVVDQAVARRHGDEHRVVRGPRIDRPSIGRIAAQGEVRAKAVVVSHVLLQKIARLSGAEDQGAVHHVLTNRANHPLGHRVLPGRGVSGSGVNDPELLFEKNADGVSKDVVVVGDHVFRSRRVGEDDLQLLDDPCLRGMIGRGQMQKPSPGVLDDDQTVKRPAEEVEHGEEVHRGHAPPEGAGELFPVQVVLLARWPVREVGANVPRDSAAGNVEVEFEQFAVNPVNAEMGVLAQYAVDGVEYLPFRRGPTGFFLKPETSPDSLAHNSGPGPEGPYVSVHLTNPVTNGCGPDQRDVVGPVSDEADQKNDFQAVAEKCFDARLSPASENVELDLLREYDRDEISSGQSQEKRGVCNNTYHDCMMGTVMDRASPWEY